MYILPAMALPHPMPPDLSARVARRFKALSDPMRVRILDSLREGERSVGDLSSAWSSRRSTLFHRFLSIAPPRWIQQRRPVVRSAAAGVEPGTIGYVEGHGTCTG